jgi:hypothetical protein
VKCPHCGHEKSRVLETRGDRRVRQCGECLKDFATYECLAAYAGRHAGWIHEQPPVEAPVKANYKGVTKSPKEWWPVTPDFVSALEPELGNLLLAWWNESRRQKQGKKAAWTKQAWISNVERVQAMPLKRGLALARRGVESGWQSLQEKYLEGETTSDDGTFMPADPAMRAALESWN